MTFGEEIARAGYGTDAVRQKFTSYERDNETELDFAQARTYASMFGRFTSVDPLYESANPKVPQSWNRYNYALNNPILFVDPTGLSSCDPATDPTCRTDNPPIPKECVGCSWTTGGDGKPIIVDPNGQPWLPTLPAERVEIAIKLDGEGTVGTEAKPSWWKRLLMAVGLGGAATVGGTTAAGGTVAGTTAGGGVTAAVAVSAPGITTIVSATVNGQSGNVNLQPTFDRIKSGLLDSHKNDGSRFKNNTPQGGSGPLLPVQSDPNYYREWVIRTPGVNHAGTQRLVTGNGGEVWYTPDHYDTFTPLNDAARACGCGPGNTLVVRKYMSHMEVKFNPEIASLRDGMLSLYHDVNIFTEDIEWFKGENYKTYIIHYEEIKTIDQFYEEIGSVLEFPSYHARNLNAFEDNLCELEFGGHRGALLVFYRYDKFLDRFRDLALDVLDIIANVARLYLIDGERLICLVQSNETRLSLPKVGGYYICSNGRESSIVIDPL